MRKERPQSAENPMANYGQNGRDGPAFVGLRRGKPAFVGLPPPHKATADRSVFCSDVADFFAKKKTGKDASCSRTEKTTDNETKRCRIRSERAEEGAGDTPGSFISPVSE